MRIFIINLCGFHIPIKFPLNVYSAAHLSKKLIFIEQIKKRKINLQIQSIQYQLCQLQYPYRKYEIFHP